MINLLDADVQKQQHAARTNLQLRRYLGVLLITLVLIAGLFGAGAYLTWSERALAESELKTADAAVSSYAQTRNEAEDFSSNLKIAKSILSQEVLYSDMIVQIAKALPANSVLSSLSLDSEALQKPLTIEARVKTKQDAVTLKNTLESSSLFEDVNINNIIEEPVPETAPEMLKRFPTSVTITMKATKVSQGGLAP